MNKFKPEGCLFRTAANQKLISSPEGLTEAMEKNITLEARASICDSEHNLIVELPCGKALIRHEEGAVGIAEGTTKDIALISRVNKIVCFKVIRVGSDTDSKFCAVLSRRAAQEECISNYISHLSSGDVIDAKVTHLEKFGCFVDIGCGIPSLIPIDAISVSRISHPSDRFANGDDIRAVVTSNENGRICLTHKELLGTWEENAAEFNVGETVSGIVRSIEDYGIFVELAPNLAGLAESRTEVKAGQNVSVYIKAIIPEKMKIKLVIVDVCDDTLVPVRNRYFYNDAHMDFWNYAPECSGRKSETHFN
jgi:predicted RNA-binding protein with RPS1 domain